MAGMTGEVMVLTRPPRYQGFGAEQRAAICDQILYDVSGGMLVKDACKKAGINRDTLHAWAVQDRALSDAYTRARALQAHAMAEHAIDIADGRDDQSKDEVQAMVEYIQGVDEDDKERVLAALTQVQVQRDRLRVDTRKWMTSKIAPRDYGEKVAEDAGARRSVIFMPEAGLVEGRARSEVTMRQLAEASSPDAPTEEMAGYEYVDVDETPRELQGDDPDADVPRSGLPVVTAVAFPTKEAEILARRRAKRPIEGIAPAVIPSDTPKPNGKKNKR